MTFNDINYAEEDSDYDSDDDPPTSSLKCSYKWTKTEDNRYTPGRMKRLPKYRLIEVCKKNGYPLSINDFDRNMYSLGKGGFGRVLLVR
jgi:hypothetical protein